MRAEVERYLVVLLAAALYVVAVSDQVVGHVADIKAEILRYVGPPTAVIFRYLTETHPEAISAETSLSVEASKPQ